MSTPLQVYQVQFTNADGTQITGELITPVSLPANSDWTLVPNANGNIYSAYVNGVLPNPPSMTWTQPPDLLNETTSISIDFSTYSTPSAGATYNYSIGGVTGGTLPTGWTWNGVEVLSYNGTSVNASASSITMIGTPSGGTLTVGPTFKIQGSGTPSTDTFPTTIPTGLTLTGQTLTANTFSCDPVSDPSPTATSWSGVGGYRLFRNGTLIASAVAAALGPKTVFTGAAIDRGTAFTTPTTYSQSSSAITITSTTHQQNYPTADGGGFAPASAITGTAWMCTYTISGFTPTNAFANARVLITAAPTDATSAYVAAVVSSQITGGNGPFLEARATKGGSTASIGANTSLISSPQTVRVVRLNDTYTMYAGANKNALVLVGTTTVVMGSTVSVLPGVETNDGTSCTAVYSEFNITNLASPTFTDSSPSSSTATYTVKSYDAAGTPDVSAAGDGLSVAPLSSGGGGSARWNPGHYIAHVSFNSASQIAEIVAVCNANANVKGININLNWNKVETSQGVYDTSLIDNALSALNTGKTCIVQIALGALGSAGISPSSSIPSYIYTNAIYGNSPNSGQYGYWTLYSTGGVFPNIYANQNTLNRVIAMYQYLGDRYNGNPKVEGIGCGDESATTVNIDGGNNASGGNASGITGANYRAAYKSLYTAAISHYSNFQLGGCQVNFTSGDISETNCAYSLGLIDDIYTASHKVSLNWPDTYGGTGNGDNFTDAQHAILGQANGSGTSFVYAGKFPEWGNVEDYQVPGALDYQKSPSQIAPFAINTLKVTHLIWWYLQGSGSGDFQSTVLPAINANPITAASPL